MPFVEDPARLSKTRLKSDLVAHNVALPPAASKREVYVELHRKHIDQKNAATFSSDEDDCVEDVTDKKEPEDAEVPVPSGLTDDDLKAALLKHGVKAGPIVATTRALYEKKLQKLLQSEHKRLNEAEKAVLYSDSEEEENQKAEESRSEKQRCDQPDKTQEESSQRACPPRNTESSSNWNSRNVLKSSEWSQSQSHCSQISRTSSADHHTGLGSWVPPRSESVMSNDGSSSSQSFSITQMVEEMENRSSLSVTDNEGELEGSNVQENQSQSSRLSQELARVTFKDILLDRKTVQKENVVTCRRPIKGAAQRPVRYAYPSSPVSPMTQRRREVERHLVPIHIQILVFLIVACVLYLLYVNVEDSQNYWSESDDELLL